MTHHSRSGVPFVTALLAAAFAATLATPASALFQRTFVRSDGLDTNPCNLPAPCRSFNAAIAQTSAGGEVVILDTAGYGPMVINKSIKIIGPAGVYGGISVLGGIGPPPPPTTGIVINAGDNDDITLRGLDVSGVPGLAPLPQFGIDIQNAGGVHIEKSSIGNFTDAGSACVNLNTAKTVRVYVIDSFLRECRAGVQANGTVALANPASVIIDNTRFERHRAAVETYGVWIRNNVSVTIRNSQISRVNSAIQVEETLDGAVTTLRLIGSQLTRSDRGITFVKTANNAFSNFHLSKSQIDASADLDISLNGSGGSHYMSMIDSEISGGTTAVSFTNTGIGHASQLKIMDSLVAWTTNGILLTQSAADPNTRMYVEITRATVGNITNAMILAAASNGSKLYVNAESVMFGNSGTVLKTSGNSQVSASIVRSQIHNCTTVVDHGSAAGAVRIDGNHFVSCTNDFVNSGSNNMVTFKNNFIHNIDNTGGLTYITPADVLPR